MRAHTNPFTGVMVHRYRPIRLLVQGADGYPEAAANFLARIVMGRNARPAPLGYLFERTSDPDAADFILFYPDINYHENEEGVIASWLPESTASRAKMLFVDHRDAPAPFAPFGVHLKPSLLRAAASSTVIAIPYLEAVDDFRWYASCPSQPTHDVVFFGEATPLRRALVAALQATELRGAFALHNSFFHRPMLSRFTGNHGEVPLTEHERENRRGVFIAGIRQSRFALAPRGYGQSSFRFYEALSLGIPPILVSGDCAMPFDDEVDYTRFAIQLPADIPAAVEGIVGQVAATDEVERLRMGREGRAAYDQYLSYEAALLPIYRRLLQMSSRLRLD